MNNLRLIRSKQGFSIEELATNIGVTSRYIRFIEDGQKTPSLKVAMRLASFLNVQIEDIFLPCQCTISTYSGQKKKHLECK